MESDLSQILFCVFAACALICALAVVIARNPVNSAMNMALCFGFVAAIFFGMGAEFLGIVQLVVYAGAILVLFLFIIMMLDVKAEERSHHNLPAAVAGVAVATATAAIICWNAWSLPGAQDLHCPAKSFCAKVCDDLSLSQKKDAPATQEEPMHAPYGGPLPQLSPAAAAKALGATAGQAEAATTIPDTKLLGRTLFGRYNIAFVILGFALLSGTVGSIALSRKLKA